MKSNLKKKLEKFTRAKKRNKIIKNVLLGIASLMVFVTVYVLILPAITADKENLGMPEQAYESEEPSEATTVAENESEADVPADDPIGESLNTEPADDIDSDNIAEPTTDQDETPADDDVQDDANVLAEESHKENEDTDNATDDNNNSVADDADNDSTEDTTDQDTSDDDTDITNQDETTTEEENADEDTTDTENASTEEEPTTEEDVTQEEPVAEEFVVDENLTKAEIEAQIEDVEEKLLADNLTEEELITLNKQKVALEARLQELIAAEETEEEFVVDENLTKAEIEAQIKDVEEKLLADNLTAKEIATLQDNKLALETRLAQLLEEEQTAEQFVVDENLGKTELEAQIKEIEEKLKDDTLADEERAKLQNNKVALETRLQEVIAELKKTIVLDGLTPLTEEQLALLTEEELAKLEAGRSLEISTKAIEAPVMRTYSAQTRSDNNTFVKGRLSVLLPLGVSVDKITMEASFETTPYTYSKQDADGNNITYQALTGYDIKIKDKTTGNQITEFKDLNGTERNIKITIHDVNIKAADKDLYELNYITDSANENLTENDKEKIAILSVSDTNVDAGNGEKYGKLAFTTTHFSKYVLFKPNNATVITVPAGIVIDTEQFETLVTQYKLDNPSATEYPMQNTVLIKANQTYTLNEAVSRKVIEDASGIKTPYQHQLFHVQKGGKLIVASTLSGSASKTPLIVNKGTLDLTSSAVLQNNQNNGVYDNRTKVAPVLNVGDKITSVPYLGAGGAVWSSGNVTLNGNATIQHCQAQIGGGLFVEGNENNTVNFTMNSAHILNNKAKYYNTTPENLKTKYPHDYSKFDVYRSAGGGIYLGDYVHAIINGGTISGNTSDRVGGGVSLRDINRNPHEGYANLSTLTVNGGMFSGNTAKMSGGALCICSNSDAVITSGDFIGNTANGYEPRYGTKNTFSGGGIYIDEYERGYSGKEGTLKLRNALIQNNTSEKYGGGLAACPEAHTKIYSFEGAVFYNNEEEQYSDLNGKDISIKNTTGHGGSFIDPPSMLGGFTFTIYGFTEPDNEIYSYYRAKANVTQDDVENIKHLINVKIEKNTGYLGGGIGCNGTLIIGTETEEEPTEQRIAVSVTKKWQADDTDHPAEVQVVLKQNGETFIPDGEESPISLNEANNWQYTWQDLPYKDGYQYTVEEVELAGYTANYVDDGATYEPVTEPENGFNYKISLAGKYLNTNSTDNILPELEKNNASVWRIYKNDKDIDIVDEQHKRYLAVWKTSNNIWNAKSSDKDDIRNKKFNYDGTKLYSHDYYNRKIYLNSFGHNGYGSHITTSKKNYHDVIFYKEIAHNFVITNSKKIGTVDINLKKVSDTDVDNQGKPALLDGAEFELYIKANDGNVTLSDINSIKANKIGSIIATDNGFASITGLRENNIYFLKEVSPPQDHKLLDKIVVFKINSDGFIETIDNSNNTYDTSKFIIVNGDGDNSIAYTELVGNNPTTIIVKNAKDIDYTLPETGGVGTELYTLLGIIMMATAIGIILIRKKGKRRA